MGIRGRQSAASVIAVPFAAKHKPDPPAELTVEQAEIWRSVVATKPAEWFTPDSYPLLVAYCRMTIDARGIEALIVGFDPAWTADEEGMRRYAQLLRLRAQNAAGLAQLATKMRISQQSRFHNEKAATLAKHETAGTKPWQRGAAQS